MGAVQLKMNNVMSAVQHVATHTHHHPGYFSDLRVFRSRGYDVELKTLYVTGRFQHSAEFKEAWHTAHKSLCVSLDLHTDPPGLTLHPCP